jgi:hypothetical protein
MPTTTATMRPGCPRYRDWLEVFGGDTIPVVGPFPGRHTSPSYRVDVSALTPMQRERLARWMGRRLGEDPEEVDAGLDHEENWPPIPARDVIVGGERA